MQDSGHDQAQRGQKPRQNAKSRVEIVDLRAFLRFPGAAASLQATKAKNQRSRDSYAGFRPRQSPARPKHRYNAKSRDLRAFLRFPGAAASLRATKAKNQRSRNSYAGFRPRQSPARPKPWYNAKSCCSSILKTYFRMNSQICQLHLVTLFKLAPNCADACNTILRMP